MERTTTSSRTTIRLPDALHRQLKVLAAERGTTMQDLLEAALKIIVESGLDRPVRDANTGTLRIPPHLETVVETFIEFWQHPKNPTEMQIRRLLETVLGLSHEK